MSRFEYTHKSHADVPFSPTQAARTLIDIAYRLNTPKRIVRNANVPSIVGLPNIVLLDEMVIVALLGVRLAQQENLNEAEKAYFKMVQDILWKESVTLSHTGQPFWVLTLVGTNINKQVNPVHLYGLHDLRKQKPNNIVVGVSAATTHLE